VFQSIGTNVSETVLTKANHQLIMTGPYEWVRHPLYATGGMLFIGIGLMAANWFILLFASLAVALIWWVAVPLEERALVAKFGDDYRGYAARTGGLFPRLTGAKH
jgi:protein-S-isoprenylcysteine O-methyltransferase Ste14